MMKRLFCLILTLSLTAGLLSGCGGNQEPRGDVAMGRYIEEKGEVLEGITRVYSPHRDGAGDIVFYAEREDESVWRWVLPAGGGEARSQEVTGLAEATEGIHISKISEGPDGTLLVLCSKFETNQNTLLRSDGNGGFDQVTVSDWDAPAESGTTGGNSVMAVGGVSAAVSGEVDAETEETGGDAFSFFQNQKMAYGLLALKGGGFLLCYGEQGATQYDRDGAVVRVYPGPNYGNQIALWENKLLMSGGESGEFTLYDVDTGAQIGTANYENGDYFAKLGLDEQGLYLGDSSGIYRQVENGDLWEKLVDGSLTTLTMPTVGLVGLVSDGAGGFVGFLESGNIQIVRYVFSETTPTTPDTELTIFSLHDNNTVRQAIGEFQRKNPNVRVNFQIMMDETSGATAQDIINSLNTELLSGKGPDLLLLDGLPVESYIDKGVLSDISDLVKGNGDLYQNLMNAYEREGKVYGVPTRFSFPAMAGVGADLDRITSLETLVALVQAEQGDEVPLLVPPLDLWSENLSGMRMDYYGLCSGDWLSADGTIDQLGLARYITNVTDLEATLKEHKPQSDSMITGTVMVSAGSAGIAEVIDMGFWYLAQGTGRVYLAELGSLMNMRDLMKGENLELRSAFGSNKYTPKGGVGVVSTGKQQELARSFVETLLSGTVQDVNLADGLPVNRASMDKMIAQIIKESDYKRDLGLSALCGGLNTPILTDQVIQDALEDQLRKMAAGTLTPEQAAADLVDRVQIYLSE